LEKIALDTELVAYRVYHLIKGVKWPNLQVAAPELGLVAYQR